MGLGRGGMLTTIIMLVAFELFVALFIALVVLVVYLAVRTPKHQNKAAKAPEQVVKKEGEH